MPEAAKVLDFTRSGFVFTEKRKPHSSIGGASLSSQRGLCGFGLSEWSQRGMFRCWATLINHKIPPASASLFCFHNPPIKRASSALIKLRTWDALCFVSLSLLVLSPHTDVSNFWSQGSHTALRWCNPEPIISSYPLSASGLSATSDSITRPASADKTLARSSDAAHIESCPVAQWVIISSAPRWCAAVVMLRYCPAAAEDDAAVNRRVFPLCLQTSITVPVHSPQEGSRLRPLINCLTLWVVHHVWLWLTRQRLVVGD